MTNQKIIIPPVFLDDKEIEKRIEAVKSDKLYYPQIHIAPKYGLLNDPNGLCYFNDTYHIFHQYHPNNVEHGLKHWRHLTTTDFVNYQDLNIKLTPEFEFENSGIFSGGATSNDSFAKLFYTAQYIDPVDLTWKPKQCLALMNPDYKITEKTIICDTNPKYTGHYRDPFPFTINEENYLLVGAQTTNTHKGCLSIISLDEQDSVITEKTVFFNGEVAKAYMYECPTIFFEDNYECLIFSPQGVKSTHPELYNNIYDVIYQIQPVGTLFSGGYHEDFLMLDYGFDFYAPQVFNDGINNIMIAWLGHSDTIYPYDVENGWSQLLSIPRVLTIKNGMLFQTPHDSIDRLRTNKRVLTSHDSFTRSFDIVFDVAGDFSLTIGNENNWISFDYKRNIFTFDRSNMDILCNEQYGNTREKKVENLKNVRIIFDMSVVEVFLNYGMFTMSARVFINQISKISFTNISPIIYDLNSININ